MRHVARYVLLLLLFIATSSLYPQQDFDLQAYQDFLNQHATLSASGLCDLHSAGVFTAGGGFNPDSALSFNIIDAYYRFTAQERSLLATNGFLVTERLSRPSFGAAFKEIYSRDLPVFISADAILHAFHMSYDIILKNAEEPGLSQRLKTLLAGMHGSVPELIARYDTVSGMADPLDDIDLYLAIARKLLGDSVTLYRSSNSSRMSDLMDLIAGFQPAGYPLFSDGPRMIDFSQLKPRGHYTQSQVLTRYFQSMMWLGRTELQLNAAQNTLDGPTPAYIRRQTVDAFLVLESLELSGQSALADSIDTMLRLFVGESDNLTINNLRYLRAHAAFQAAKELLDDSTRARMVAVLKEQSWAIQRINSQILYSDVMSPTQVVPPSAFLLLGQRFVIDSYVTGSVVYDKIVYEGHKIFRKLPSSLDVLFALGNDAAAQLLTPELDLYHYSPNLAALRYLVDSYDSTFWKMSVYNAWLSAIRSLNPPGNRSGLPAFMQTAGWWQEKMNSQLASWAQLRHDNLLYAKQSYTGGAICSFPSGYVEPVPEFYRSMKKLAEVGKGTVEEFSSWWIGSGGYIRSYFERMASCMDTLGSIAEKELEGTALSALEQGFVTRMLYQSFGCVPTYDGWYPHLYVFDVSGACDTVNYIVADVHTVPTDEVGNPIGWVLHCGTGPLNLGVVLASVAPGRVCAFIGPVLSYYEHVTVNFQRLTDEEWDTLYALAPSIRPSWVNLYLADQNGEKLPAGPALITGAPTHGPNDRVPESFLLRQNYPNPFNPSTLIGFRVPGGSHMSVDLGIYDLTGRKVRQLLQELLPGGEYFVQWDGRREDGVEAASGVYFYRLRSGNTSLVKQMILLR